MPFDAWRELPPEGAAREVHARIAALPGPLRRAAVAWLKPEPDLARELAGGPVSPAAAQAARLVLGSRQRTTGRPANPPSPFSSLPSLHGIPYLLKDLFDLRGIPTFAGSTFLPQVRPAPANDSRLVQHLTALGAACVGKTHLVEFASGLTGENPHYGDCPHPHFPYRLSGGSSSGSAALVAAGVVPLAIGTDTGGSVRVPAAWCGLYGFRLTPHDEYIRDAFPLAPTLDTAGWFTANARDLLTTWQAVLGNDLAGGPQPRGLYLPARTLLPEIDPLVADACDAAAARLGDRADEPTTKTLLTAWRDAVDAYVTIGMSEAHAVHRAWLEPYREQYDPIIWKRFTDAGRYPPEQIARARDTLATVRRAWSDFFQAHDFLILPAVPCAAPRKAEATPELRRRILALNAPTSLGGLPVLSLPVALGGGLTAGLQVVLPKEESAAVPWILNGAGVPRRASL